MRLIVFTDLDGTLLDHHSYDWAPARPALERLAARGVPVVLASSKTAAELAPLRAQMGLERWPAIVENGAAVLASGKISGAPDDADWRRLRAALSSLPAELAAAFRGFGDMSVVEVAQATGLSLTQAALARRRCHSEPGLWLGDATGRARFLAALARQGITGREGGRFLTLSFGSTKAARMQQVAAALDAGATLALGDAPNDIEMLEAADHGFIIGNDQGPGIGPLAGEATGRIRRAPVPGPAGWSLAVLEFLSEFDTDTEASTRDG